MSSADFLNTAKEVVSAISDAVFCKFQNLQKKNSGTERKEEAGFTPNHNQDLIEKKLLEIEQQLENTQRILNKLVKNFDDLQYEQNGNADSISNLKKRITILEEQIKNIAHQKEDIIPNKEAPPKQPQVDNTEAFLFGEPSTVENLIINVSTSQDQYYSLYKINPTDGSVTFVDNEDIKRKAVINKDYNLKCCKIVENEQDAKKITVIQPGKAVRIENKDEWRIIQPIHIKLTK